MLTLSTRCVVAFLALTSLGIAQPRGGSLDTSLAPSDVLREDPYRRAVLLDLSGPVHQPITTKDPKAQAFFDQGLWLFHGGSFAEAERSFREATALDGDCAMAFLGRALANAGDGSRAAALLVEAKARREHASQTERRYIEIYAKFWGADRPLETELVDAERGTRRAIVPKRTTAQWESLLHELHRFVRAAPKEREGRALLVREAAFAPEGVALPEGFDGRRELEGLLSEVPDHPASRYATRWTLLGSADTLTLPSRQRSARAWFDQALLWRTTGRTDLAVAALDASLRVSHGHLASNPTVLFPSLPRYVESSILRASLLRQRGRYREAEAAARDAIRLPQHPSYPSHSARRGAEQLAETLVAAERWEELLTLIDSPWLAAMPPSSREFQRAQAYLGLDRIDAARSVVDKFPPTAPYGHILRTVLEARQGHRDALTALSRVGYPKPALARLALSLQDPKRSLEFLRDAGTAPSAETMALEALAAWRSEKKDRAREVLAALETTYPDADSMPASLRVLFGEPPSAPKVSSPTTRTDSSHEVPPVRRAAPFTLPSGDGEPLTLGPEWSQPTLLVFYLGFGCLHCVEQLNALKPRAEDFARAGLRVVTVGSDALDKVRAAFQQARESDTPLLPFPILCDPEGEIFRRYGCWDEFKNEALHGTFVIDRRGHVLWQDISAEPFMDTGFLLAEAQRLASLPPTTR